MFIHVRRISMISATYGLRVTFCISSIAIFISRAARIIDYCHDSYEGYTMSRQSFEIHRASGGHVALPRHTRNNMCLCRIRNRAKINFFHEPLGGTYNTRHPKVCFEVSQFEACGFRCSRPWSSRVTVSRQYEA